MHSKSLFVFTKAKLRALKPGIGRSSEVTQNLWNRCAGFARVKIEPHLGTIKRIGGDIPYPNVKNQRSLFGSKRTYQWRCRAPFKKNRAGYLEELKLCFEGRKELHQNIIVR